MRGELCGGREDVEAEAEVGVLGGARAVLLAVGVAVTFAIEGGEDEKRSSDVGGEAVRFAEPLALALVGRDGNRAVDSSLVLRPCKMEREEKAPSLPLYSPLAAEPDPGPSRMSAAALPLQTLSSSRLCRTVTLLCVTKFSYPLGADRLR